MMPADIGNSMYPTPCKKIENPAPTVLQRGDVVELLIGPAAGRIGRVVVERNANYRDYEPYAGPESIAVAVVEKIPVHPSLEKIAASLSDPEALFYTAVRWCDSPDQLRRVSHPTIPL